MRSLDAVPHNLPAVLTSFIGREQELATVTGLVREERLVTLTGSGGCGKTRLALHAAADLVEHHPGGTWWVDLAPVTTADAAAERVAGAVGASAAPGADTTALVVRHLRDSGRTLVVIDNAEHVLEAMAALVDAVLSACPDVHVLVTSREPLGVAGELVWRVPSLRGPAAGVAVAPERLDAYEAARLFLERARRVRPNLVVDDDTAAHVVAICVRLDGIPLALELAAARTRTVPLDRLARGLDDAFRLLTGGARTALPRQQTLLASIAWSVDLLDDAERAVLRRLAVFRGPFPLEAAEAVAADDVTSSRATTCSTSSAAWSTRAWSCSTTPPAITGCWRPSASSPSTASAKRASWPRPVTVTPPGSSTGANRSTGASTTSTSARPTRCCPTCSPPSTGPTTPRPPRPTASAAASPASGC